MQDAKDNFNIKFKIDLGEGLGGGLIHEVSAEKKQLIVNSVEGRVFKMPMNAINVDHEEWTGAYSHLIEYQVLEV